MTIKNYNYRALIVTMATVKNHCVKLSLIYQVEDEIDPINKAAFDEFEKKLEEK